MSVFRNDDAPRGMGPLIPCGCECGGTLRQFDDKGRERKFLPGHQSRVMWRSIKSRDPVKTTQP